VDAEDQLDEGLLPQIVEVSIVPTKEPAQRAIHLRSYPIMKKCGDLLVACAHRGQELAVIDIGGGVLLGVGLELGRDQAKARQGWTTSSRGHEGHGKGTVAEVVAGNIR
jgi:hypothetical protein